MKTRNVKLSKWMRRASQMLVLFILTISITGQASARIIFQDDDFQEIVSEGILLNSDDAGDEDVTLQFGNDASDATIIFDDGTGDVTFATDGGDFSFSDDNITTTGDLSATDIAGTGVINFASATRMAMPQGASNPGTCTEGDLFYNTTDNATYSCTATDTWTALSSGNQDFEGVYGTDADNTLTTSNGAFTIDTGSNDFIVDSNDWQVDASGNLTANSLSDGTASLSSGTLSGLTGIDATTEDTIEGAIFDADAESVSGVWTWNDNVAQEFGSDSDVLIQYDETTDDRLEITGPNADVYMEDSLTVNTNATVNGTFDANGTVTLGDGGDTVAIDSSDWDVSTSGDMTGIGAITMDGLLTGTAGATLSGASISLNNNSNFAVNLATGSSTGLVSIGGGAGTAAVNTTTWDITAAGVASGFTGFTSTGTIDFSGASRFAMQSGAANPGTCTEGDMFYNTTDNTLYVCTAANTWTGQSSGNPDFEAVYGNDGDSTLTASGTFDIDATGAVGIDSDAGVTVGGAGISLTSDGGILALTGDGTNDIDISNAGAAIDIDSATIDIDTTSTIDINSSTWDISSAGAASGFTTFTASGDITTSGGDFYIGTTGLTETTSATDSGAYLIGTFDEFDNSNGTNVQDVLDDLDALVGSNAPNVDEMTFEPEYPDAVVYQDGSNNKGTLAADYDSGNSRQYYRWDTSKNSAQDIDVRFRYELPADFDDAGNLTLRYRTNTTNTADNSVAITVRNDTDGVTCHADPAAASAAGNTWNTLTITGAEIDTGCTGGNLLAAGDVIEVIMKLSADDTNTGFADVGELVFDYTN